MRQLPVIDVGPLCAGDDAEGVAREIRHACESIGFFYAVGHGVDDALQARLAELSRDFFARDLAEKMRIRMELGGRAWRGYFPPGAELTSGRPDLKEGIYFGAELGDDHPLVRNGTPLHGRNLFPEIEGFRAVVLDYMSALTRVGHALMRGVARSLGLDEAYFARLYTAEPLILFRIFNYPPPADGGEDWGVGEHTDYGLLTVLKQDEAGGLEVKAGARWLEAPPIDGSFVCNIGDMLDRMTGGRYRSTPHRVRNRSGRPRLSFPFFFDPCFAAEVTPIAPPAAEDRDQRWDRASVHDFRGTYGEYLLGKVAKVFPALRQRVL